MRLPRLDDVQAAAERLNGVAHRTPVLTSHTLDALVSARVFCKAENFQRVGAFKFRGAYNAVAAIEPQVRAAGVLAFSSGNHAQAVALAAALHEVPAVIVMPTDAPAGKLAATRGYGAEVVLYDRYTEDREQRGRELADQRGLTVVPPFDHPDVIAGQGTVALELFEDAGPLDTLLVCVGGGGLISGCATVAKSQAGPVRVVGVEPAAGDDVRRSLAAGEIVTIPVPRTIADGQQTTAPGPTTFAVMRERVDDVVVVTDEQIVAAMRFAFERMKIVLEPSGASALAALLAGVVDPGGGRIGVTLSGGNITAARFTELCGAAGDA
jgi:threo-3-hydroxy-L-aspartate ammonia-lyase